MVLLPKIIVNGTSDNERRDFFVISTSNSLQKLSAIQKVSVTLTHNSILKSNTHKLSNINGI